MNPTIDLPFSATHRLPAWALGVSLAVHIAVLAWPLLPRQPALTDLPPLVVNFRQPATLAPAVAERAPEPPRVVPPTPAAAVRATVNERKVASVPKPTVLAVATPTPGPIAVSTPAEPLPALAAASPAAPVTERSEAAPLARPAEAGPAAESADAAAMARYIRLLGELLAQQQQYPRLAAARGWEGEVRLRLQVARKGTIIAVHITHSSGFDVLDRHAVNLVQSTPLPPPPAAHLPTDLSNGASPDFLIDIPIHYTLKRS